VFVLDETGQPRPVDVRVGISDGQFVEIRAGLDEGDSVVTGTQIPGAALSTPRAVASPSSNPFTPQRPQRRQR
jgi:multidrug efflux pump subunit AcrA (membrane-fusion protein)